MLDYEVFYAHHARGAERSLIRELLKVSRAGKGFISFAGGFPDPATFPVAELQEVTREVLEHGAALALQYGPTEGDPTLRDELVGWMAKDGIAVDRENVLVTTSSQQGLDVIGRAFLNPGDVVIVELPSYLGGLQVFRAYGAEMIGVPQDDEGMDTRRLAEVLRRLGREGRRPKFIYAVPDFQNPSGVTWTLERRKELLTLAHEAGCLVVEDNPYRELRFAGSAPPPIVALDSDRRTVYLSTFSKTLAPGLRIGWIAGPEPVIAQFVTLKQAMDLCSPSFTQAIAAALLRRGDLLRRLPATIDLYRRKREVMLEALQREMPEGVTWTRPEGGLFLWVRLPEDMDSGAMLQQAVAEGVMYVPGQPFHADGGGRNTMRLNFSYPSEDEIRSGIARLAHLVHHARPATVHTIHRRRTSVSD